MSPWRSEPLIVARPGDESLLEKWVRLHGTLAAAAAERGAAGALEGRGGVHVVPSPGGGSDWVVRHYHRGGAVASLLGDRYLRLGTPRPMREFAVGLALEAMGVPTPRHVGAAVYPSGIWYRGDLVTELVPGSRDLADVLFGGGVSGSPAPVPSMRAAGRLVRLLHERGVIHRDLNLKNILIASAEGGGGEGVRALALDLDRASIRARVSGRARRRMIERFWRSARKWEEKTGRPLDPGHREAFDAGYAEER